MKVIFTLFFCLCGGFACHQARQLINGSFQTPPLREMASYSVGTLAMIPFSTALSMELDEIDCPKRHIISVLLTGLCFGLGVLAGYVVDEVK